MKELVAIFDGHIFNIKSVRFQSSRWFQCSKSVVGEFVLVDVDGVVLCVAQIDGIYRGSLNSLGDLSLGSAPNKGAEHESK